MSMVELNPQFGFRLVADVGASRPEATLKAVLLTDNGDEVDRFTGTVADPGQRFENADGFVNALGKRLAGWLNQLKQGGQFEAALNGEDEKLSRALLMVPGPTENATTVRMTANLKDQHQKPLEHLDFSRLGAQLQREAKLELADDYRVLITNDMPGIAAALAKWVAAHPQLGERFKEGLEATVVMTGGGCGVINFRLLPGEAADTPALMISANEKGHHPAALRPNPPSLESDAASVPALINNYLDGLGFRIGQRTREVLVNLGNGKLITQWPIRTEATSEEAQTLRSSGMFQEGRDGATSLFTLIGVPERAHQRGQAHALNKYVEAVAHLAAEGILAGNTLFLLTGPVVQGVDGALRQSQHKTLADAVLQAALAQVDAVGKNQAKLNQFAVVTYTEPLDNTAGGALMLEATAAKNRGNWYFMPASAMKAASSPGSAVPVNP